MSREGKNCISILVDKILIFNFPGHHDESFDQGWDRLHVKTLVVGKQDAETNDEQLTTPRIDILLRNNLIAHVKTLNDDFFYIPLSNISWGRMQQAGKSMLQGTWKSF